MIREFVVIHTADAFHYIGKVNVEIQKIAKGSLLAEAFKQKITAPPQAIETFDRKGQKQHGHQYPYVGR